MMDRLISVLVLVEEGLTIRAVQDVNSPDINGFMGDFGTD
jgi:hypothetical protein